MPRTRVQSNNIASIGYDEKAEILEVEFRNGSVYQYYGVPKRIYVGLMNASSHGAYLAQYVKDAGYRYKEVN
ncbi:KTSC domain-containing protein [Hymenobacter sediminicola]|uniref:KTSC domain-containing protein n=1 Tax=Hymenobacter sediminicola TaxID=2761579 RepID=A0A7G7WCZ0_9BACT|nr:KTSC domain-containing protein [Hymenobacter sediminicola]